MLVSWNKMLSRMVDCWSLFTCHDFLVGDRGLWMRQLPQRKNCSIVIICHIEVLNLCFKVCPLKHFTFNPVNILATVFFVLYLTCAGPHLGRRGHRVGTRNGCRQSRGWEEFESTASTAVDTGSGETGWLGCRIGWAPLGIWRCYKMLISRFDDTVTYDHAKF